ncbi:HD domain-containing phosphohydrolase [Deinococcus humi]|uniref:Putative nucleotidyltransferase with HDIG domain n=1 Tax=Deinococcus humi TaxID=662880 RepID=A0A7W8NJ70_9DEIO|nr:HD domain-containing phosphohydrolase [Deinococcus humi]MBB5365822.1 putative nucleotidyltransferase with HDIG domain [Deinococcus humi]GGO39360.1 phosphohydrolase [Deinococcus humi]
MESSSVLKPRVSDLIAGDDARTTAAQSVLTLTRLAVSAPDLASGVTPTLEHLVTHTAAVGSAYFQVGGAQALTYQVRAAWGEMPQTPGMQHIAIHGLPSDTPLMRALEVSTQPLFFDDTSASPQTAGFPELGVASLAACPVCDAEGRLLGAFLMHTLAPHRWQAEEAALFSMVSGTIAGLAGRLAADEQTIQAREAALRALGLALEARDGETQGHTDRVTTLALRMGAALSWDPARLQALRWGAYLHDIGKIAIPDAVLLKPDKLSEAEWAVMRSHVEAGVRFATALGFLPTAALNVVADHHERWNGQGYPAGKMGDAISLEGRIFALCDVYDALTSERPYKTAWSTETALAEIRTQAGQHFDPDLAQVFIEMMAENRRHFV